MKKVGYESLVVQLIIFEQDDIVRTSPNDDGAINGGNSDIAGGWWN